MFLFQPHVPVRLPCYDLIPISKLTLIFLIQHPTRINTKKYSIKMSIKNNIRPTPILAFDGRCVQDSVTNIHRSVMICDY